MRGLKTHEGNEFLAFFKLVQEEANRQGCVFFLDCGEGNEFSADGIEGEDLRGWLVSQSAADRFERTWQSGNPGDEWEDNIAWALWYGTPEKPAIKLEQY